MISRAVQIAALCALFVVFGFGVGTAPALAQATAAQPSREQLNPAARIAAPPQRAPDVFEPEPPGPCPLRDSPLRFTLASVAFKGATALTTQELAASYAGLIGRDIPVSAICDIRDRATRLFFDRGVLARVEIPEQRTVGGALILEVIEAHVVNVRVRGADGAAQAAVERYVGKLRGMTPFDMRKAQRYLLLASDIPGAQVRATIRPSVTGERGAIDIDVVVSARSVDLVGNLQNLQAQAIGRWGGLLRGDLNNVTSFGDRTSLVGYHTLGNNEQGVVQLLEEVRIGGEGLIARGSLIYGETRPGGASKPLDLSSTSFVAEAEAAYPLLRTRRRNLNLAAGADLIEEATNTGGLPLYRDRLRVVYARADGDARPTIFGRTVLFSGNLTVRQGVDGLGASKPGSFSLTRSDAEPGAWLVRETSRMVVGVADRLQFSVQTQAQYSPGRLFSYEQIALGNLTIGRGYDPAAVLGDSGASGAFELRYGPVNLHPQLAAAPYVFCDTGWVQTNGTALIKNRSLTSAGVGVLFRVFNRVNVDVTYAAPFDAPVPGGPKPTPRVLINLTANIL